MPRDSLGGRLWNDVFCVTWEVKTTSQSISHYERNNSNNRQCQPQMLACWCGRLKHWPLIEPVLHLYVSHLLKSYTCCVMILYNTECLARSQEPIDSQLGLPHEPQQKIRKNNWKLECGLMPNVMAALPNIGGALCSTPQFGWRALLECRAVTLPRRETGWNCTGAPNSPMDLSH